MKCLTLRDIAEVCEGELFNYDSKKDREVSGVVLDSRQMEEGDLFIATKGERVDGHSFIPQVFAKGAAGVVCEKEPEGEAGVYILVKDSFQALKDIARFYRQRLGVTVVGITGSVGKTSTKEFIASVLGTKYEVLKTEGNFNNEVGLPLTILKVRDCHEVAVVEMGISDFGEMHRLSEIAKPDICVLTNIGQCHLENLKSREGILKAKSEIFDFMSEDGAVCVNGDDDMLRTLEVVKGRVPMTFGMERGNMVYADGVENNGLFGSRANIHIGEEVLHTEIPLPGEHMVYNALAAACVGSLMGLTGEEIVQGIKSVKPVGGRSNIVRMDDKTVIDDCYNANPVSMCAALDLLATARTRKVAVLGDMFELGEDEKEMHDKVGAYAVKLGIDVIICIGELAREIYRGACKADGESTVGESLVEEPLVGESTVGESLVEESLVGESTVGESLVEESSVEESTVRESSVGESTGKEGDVYYFSNKEAFLEKWKDIIKEGDTVLVKASHGMAFDGIVKALAESNARQ